MIYGWSPVSCSFRKAFFFFLLSVWSSKLRRAWQNHCGYGGNDLGCEPIRNACKHQISCLFLWLSWELWFCGGHNGQNLLWPFTPSLPPSQVWLQPAGGGRFRARPQLKKSTSSCQSGFQACCLHSAETYGRKRETVELKSSVLGTRGATILVSYHTPEYFSAPRIAVCFRLVSAPETLSKVLAVDSEGCRVKNRFQWGNEIFMKVIWIISKIFGSPDLLVRVARRAFWKVLLSIESWAILGGRWCQNLTGKDSRKLQKKEEKKGSPKALACWQVCMYSNSDFCNYNAKPSAPTCLLQGYHFQAKSVPGWKENPPFGITALLGSAAVCPCVNKAKAVPLHAGSPSAARLVTLSVLCIAPFLMSLNCAIILMSSEDLTKRLKKKTQQLFIYVHLFSSPKGGLSFLSCFIRLLSKYLQLTLQNKKKFYFRSLGSMFILTEVLI